MTDPSPATTPRSPASSRTPIRLAAGATLLGAVLLTLGAFLPGPAANPLGLLSAGAFLAVVTVTLVVAARRRRSQGPPPG
jgi:hypothetical protein